VRHACGHTRPGRQADRDERTRGLPGGPGTRHRSS
jgi:hypothetical protein